MRLEERGKPNKQEIHQRKVLETHQALHFMDLTTEEKINLFIYYIN